ncbi:hypothetical protein CLIB1423_04S05138 [[Candida] railenensis]|uniref:Uncharacterized protein n=1 Tax=[Candida] railenensis TaxID=45579 RepID=A0A9P0QN20_9ASCO|nr:hypothetical protein CLIB1423_04S05138 [[Candida] railenensis]
MDSREYISDSDSDGGGDSSLITPLSVSSTRIRKVLSRLPLDDRETIATSLQNSGYKIRHRYQFQQRESNSNSQLNEDHINNQNSNQFNAQLDEHEISIENSIGESPGSFSPSRTYNIDEMFSDITYASQEENAPIKSQQTSQIQEVYESQVPLTSTSTEQEIEIEDPDAIENANHLRTYLGSKQSIYGRRGLRDRSFANAHPYLADSAHWMGLADVEILNDLYRENHDVELIVKVLNQKYLKNKRMYPREEKFKSKNFYSFLSNGRGLGAKLQEPDADQSQDQDQSQSHSILDSTKDESQNLGSQNIGWSQQYIEGQDESQTDDEYYEGILPENNQESIGFSQMEQLNSNIQNEDDLFNFPNDEFQVTEAESFIQNQDNQSNNEFEGTDDSEDDVLIQVGGRLLKEKSILHGALPESAKRLSIYQPRPKRDKKRPRKVEYRKGLAVKKNGLQVSGDSDLLKNFVDDNKYFNEIESPYNISVLDNNSPLNLLYEGTNSIGDDDQSLLDQYGSSAAIESVSESEDSGDDILNGEEIQQPFDWEVIEEDNIDPMFANSSARNGTSTFKRNKIQRRRLKDPTRIPKKNSVTSQRRPHFSNLSQQTSLFGGAISGFSRLSNLRNNRSFLSKKVTNSRKQRTPLSEINIRSNVAKISKGKASIRKSDNSPRNIQNAKEVLKSSYQFSRNPITSTVSVEVDSEKRFMKHMHPIKTFQNRRLGSVPVNLNKDDSLEFPTGFLLSRFQYSKLNLLRNGHTKLLVDTKDSVFINLFGRSYSFSLLNKSNSNENTLLLLRQFSRIVSDSRIKSNPTSKTEAYNAISGLIEWYLILQELPNDDACWQILYKICNEYGGKSENLFLYPYFVLLLHVWIQIGIGLGINSAKYSQDGYYFSKYYFKLVFENMTIEELHSSIEGEDGNSESTIHFESLYIIYLITNDASSSDSSMWWVAIDDGLKDVKGKVDHFNVLDIIYFLSTNISPPPRRGNLFWNPFYSFYASLAELDTSSTSYVYDKFLDMVFQLKDQYFWPIEEKLITLIYSSTITVRKFANFSNELIQPQLIGKLLTRDSIPDTSFFERFMYLLFSYVSEIPIDDGVKKKRLISKLFTSSHFIYRNDSRYLTMYVNRLNFILLLNQLSNKINLKGQVLDLILRIAKSDDLVFYAVTCEGLDMYTEIVSEEVQDNSDKLPLESYSIIIERVGDLYKRKKFHECLMIWDFMKTSISKWNSNPSIVLSVVCNINLFVFDDSMLFDLCDLIFNNLIKLDKSDKLLLELIYQKNLTLLQTQMGRLPIVDESKISPIIEVCISIWILSSVSLDPNVNWNELIFQKYPYLGNTYSRVKFNLYFYRELLEYLDFSNFLDTYLTLFLQTLVPGNSFAYQAKFFNSLRKKTYGNVFCFDNEIQNSIQLTNDQFIDRKTSILNTLMQNIVLSTALTGQSIGFYFKSYVDMLLKYLSEAPSPLNDDIYSSYIRNIEILQTHGSKYLKDNACFETLTRKLGLSRFQVDAYAWFDLSLKTKLSLIHSEVTTILSKSNYISYTEVFDSLEKFVKINGGGVDFIYHLVSIYSKAVVILQSEKWTLIGVLVSFLTMKLNTCQLNLTDGTLKQFTSSLAEIGYLKRDSNSRYFRHQLLTLNSITNFLHTTFYIYDGYKDQIAFKEEVLKFIENYHANVNYIQIDDFLQSFSPLRPFDISSTSNEMKESPIEINEQIDEDVLAASFNNLIHLVTSTYKTTYSDNSTDAECVSMERTLLEFEF